MLRTNLLFFALCVLLTACASRSPEMPDAATGPMAASGVVDDVLAYYQSLRRLSSQELTREMQALNARPGGRAVLSMQKAMVLGLTRDPGDLVRAQTQLSAVLNATDARAMALKPLAQLLASNYADMRRLGEAAEKAGQQARDSQRRLDQLSEKLEALKNIERTLPGQPK